MDIRSELARANVYAVDRDGLTDDYIKELSNKNKVLVVCDFGKAETDDTRKRYINAIASAGVIGDEHKEGVAEDKSLAIVVPFHSLEMAERLYRKISHASHFVTIHLEGELYSTPRQ